MSNLNFEGLQKNTSFEQLVSKLAEMQQANGNRPVTVKALAKAMETEPSNSFRNTYRSVGKKAGIKTFKGVNDVAFDLPEDVNPDKSKYDSFRVMKIAGEAHLGLDKLTVEAQKPAQKATQKPAQKATKGTKR